MPEQFKSIKPFYTSWSNYPIRFLTAPMRARFGISSRLQYYSTELLSTLYNVLQTFLKFLSEKKHAIEIAGRSRGTPRIANGLLRRVRDFAQIKGNGTLI